LLVIFRTEPWSPLGFDHVDSSANCELLYIILCDSLITIYYAVSLGENDIRSRVQMSQFFKNVPSSSTFFISTFWVREVLKIWFSPHSYHAVSYRQRQSTMPVFNLALTVLSTVLQTTREWLWKLLLHTHTHKSCPHLSHTTVSFHSTGRTLFIEKNGEIVYVMSVLNNQMTLRIQQTITLRSWVVQLWSFLKRKHNKHDLLEVMCTDFALAAREIRRFGGESSTALRQTHFDILVDTALRIFILFSVSLCWHKCTRASQTMAYSFQRGSNWKK
jgi:hypothetical protein